MGAFRTTLEELRDADLLLHVVDASSRDVEGHIHAVEQILTDLELDGLPRMLVFNKCDRLPIGEVTALCRRYGALGISALQLGSLIPLVSALQHTLPEVRQSGAGQDSEHGEVVPCLPHAGARRM